MNRKILYFSFFLILLTDTGYSFLQHSGKTLDGDMAESVVPLNSIKRVLDCPSGIDVLIKNQVYVNPNRFFSHWIYNKYFNSVPLLLQKYVEPIKSVYLSCAIFKTMVQVILIILLSVAISGTLNILKMDFIIAAVLIVPLFQTNGYQRVMGIIDPSVTYTFFYALPCALLLLYFLPFVLQFYYNKRFLLKIFIPIFWIPLAIVVCLSGALNPGIVLLFSMLVLLKKIIDNTFYPNHDGFYKRGVSALKTIPRGYWFYLLPISLLSLYSLLIGTYNSLTLDNPKPLSELYSRIPLGIYYLLTRYPGFPILFVILAFNAIIINNKYKTAEGKRILNILKWIGLFALIYVLLLPFGGYRPYRFYVLRYDTIMPITLSLMFVFGISTLFLFKNMTKNQKLWYIPIITGTLLIYTISDKANFNQNKCEKLALKEISKSKETIVPLPYDCTVISWNKILKPEDSEFNTQLLGIWRITNEKKLYYNE